MWTEAQIFEGDCLQGEWKRSFVRLEFVNRR